MRRAVVVLIVVSLVLPPVVASGGPHRWVDRHGNVIYSDRPPRPDEVAPAPDATPTPEATRTPEPKRAPGTSSAPRRPIHPATDELLDLSGLKRQMKGLSAQTRESMQQNLGHLEPRDLKAVEKMTARTLDAGLIYAGVAAEFSQHVDERRLDDVRAWYRSALGRKLTELEVAFMPADHKRDIEQFVTQWQANPPSPTRVALIQRLDAASGTTELAVEVVVGVMQAVVRVADPHLPADRRLKAGQLESQARQIRLQTLEVFRQANTVGMLYLYRDVEDSELARYIQFLESEAGAWYGNAARRALVQALGVAVERTVSELVRVVPPQRWGGPGGFKKPTLPPADKQL